MSETNMNMLRARLGGLQITITEFAMKMGFSRVTARKKIDGKVQFNAGEIQKACIILSIPIDDVPLYFFASKVAKTATNH